MLHLNFVRADLACATHAHDSASHMAQEHEPSATHAMSMQGEHAVGANESCDTPAQADCCQALVPCSLALGLNTATSLIGVLVSHDIVRVALQSAPMSRTGAPEPPPPKA